MTPLVSSSSLNEGVESEPLRGGLVCRGSSLGNVGGTG